MTVSLEMFERDVQPALDAYLGGKYSEEDFLKTQPSLAALRDRLPTARGVRQGSFVAGDRGQRPATDMRRRSPRPESRRSSALPTAERALIAARPPVPARTPTSIGSPSTMGEHPGCDTAARPTDEPRDDRALLPVACAKDETMAESIAGSFERHDGGPGLDRSLHRRVSQRLRRRHASNACGRVCPAVASPSSRCCRSQTSTTSAPAARI